jgi:hypothetical protein
MVVAKNGDMIVERAMRSQPYALSDCWVIPGSVAVGCTDKLFESLINSNNYVYSTT